MAVLTNTDPALTPDPSPAPDPSPDPAIAPRDIDRPLCRVGDLEDGRSRGFDPLGEGHDTMFVVRRGREVFGWRNACPHYGRARMAWKKDEYLNGDRARIICGAHGAQFEIDTGHCVIGPCLGKALTAVPLEIRDGAIWIAAPYSPSRRPRPGRRHV